MIDKTTRQKLYEEVKNRQEITHGKYMTDFDLIIAQEEEIRYYREKIKILTEQSEKKRNNAPENETEVLQIVNEALELLYVIDGNTEMPRGYLHEAINKLKDFRKFNYLNYIDWNIVKVDD